MAFIFLVERCLDDNDDEVRDRATFFLKIMEDGENAEKYIKDGNVFFQFS